MRGSIKVAAFLFIAAFAIFYFILPPFFATSYSRKDLVLSSVAKALTPAPMLDKPLYDKLMLMLANNPRAATSTASSTPPNAATSTVAKKYLWPADAPYPNAGALLPFNRIVAYYGNFYSKAMGVLGEYPRGEMIAKLNREVSKWNAADPSTPVIPAIQYIAVTAQGSAGDGKYRLRMPNSEIDKALDIANEMHGILILDVQVGKSTLEEELPKFASYLKLPNVHLGIDPEFSMKGGEKPGTVIGTMDATDVNYAVNFLANIVKENNLTPKIIIVHRFTQHMVTNSTKINPTQEVQVVMDMDGWGSPWHKEKAYLDTVYEYPVQFTGIKLFYKNDLRAPSTRMLTENEVLNLRPIPSYIQYQ
ncbi:MAG: hypothetical protein V4438_03100 [Patescibacteria group bacterium]